MTAPDAPLRADRGQLTRIATAFTRLGIRDRTDRLRLLADAVDRPTLHSSSQLTEAEADTIEARLKTARPPALRAHLAALVRAEETAAADRARAAGVPAGTLLCGGTPTDRDLATVAEFARQLDQRGPAPDPIDHAIGLLRERGMLAEDQEVA